MNAKTKNPEAAKAFLTWVASPDFAKLYSNALPGFFSLQTQPVDVQNPLAKEFVVLPQGLQVDDPLDLPDPVARHAQPRERDLGRIRQRHQRHRHAGSRRRQAATGPTAGTTRRSDTRCRHLLPLSREKVSRTQ